MGVFSEGCILTRDHEPNDPDLVAAREIALSIWTDSYSKLKVASDLEASLMDEAHDLVEFAVGADTRTATILLVSFLEDALKKVFVEQWNIGSQKEVDRYFGGSGPLSTFSQRALVARGLDWLAHEQIGEMDILRRIRNALAHNHRVHLLGDSELVGLVTSLPKREQVWQNREAYRSAYDRVERETQYRMRVFCSGIANVSAIIVNAKILRAQIPQGFRPESGWNGMMEVEQGLVDASIRFCWTSLGLGYTGAVYQYKRGEGRAVPNVSEGEQF